MVEVRLVASPRPGSTGLAVARARRLSSRSRWVRASWAAPQARQQLDVADAFGDEVGGAGALGLDAHVRLVVAGDDHHRQGIDSRQARGTDALQQAIAIEARASRCR